MENRPLSTPTGPPVEGAAEGGASGSDASASGE